MGVLADDAPELTAANLQALDVWRLMGRQFRIEALPLIVALVPIDDVELLLEQLSLIDARTPRL